MASDTHPDNKSGLIPSSYSSTFPIGSVYASFYASFTYLSFMSLLLEIFVVMEKEEEEGIVIVVSSHNIFSSWSSSYPQDHDNNNTLNNYWIPFGN